MINSYASNSMSIGTLSDIQNRDQRALSRADELNACKKIQCLAQACLVVVGIFMIGCGGVLAVVNSMEFDEKSLDVKSVVNRILAGCLGMEFGGIMLLFASRAVQLDLEIEQNSQRFSPNEQV